MPGDDRRELHPQPGMSIRRRNPFHSPCLMRGKYKLLLKEKLGKNVVQTQIIAILNSVYGVFKVEIESPEDIEVSEFQWANLLKSEIKMGGYADE